MASNVETPAANPIPFGLLCYGVSVFILAGFLWGGLPNPQPAIGYALFTGGLGMFLAALAAYRAGSTFGATLLAGYASFWASTAFYFWFFAPKSANVNLDLSWIVVPWAVFTGYMLICSLRTNMQAVQLLLALLFVALVLLWLATALHMPPMTLKIAAILAILSAIDAWVESYREIMDSLAPHAPAPKPTSPTPAPTG
jgi:succinate-acetate transporter protein